MPWRKLNASKPTEHPGIIATTWGSYSSPRLGALSADCRCCRPLAKLRLDSVIEFGPLVQWLVDYGPALVGVCLHVPVPGPLIRRRQMPMPYSRQPGLPVNDVPIAVERSVGCNLLDDDEAEITCSSWMS